MVELIEYVVVFAVSAGVAGASVMLVGGALPGLSSLAATSTADQLAGASRIAVIEDRNVTLVLPVRNSTVSCAGGSLSVSIGGDSRAYQVGFPCSFDFHGLNGECTFVFSAPGQELQLEVTC